MDKPEIDFILARQMFDYLVAWCGGDEQAFDDLMGAKKAMRKMYGEIRIQELSWDDFQRMHKTAMFRGYGDPDAPDAIRCGRRLGRNLDAGE